LKVSDFILKFTANGVHEPSGITEMVEKTKTGPNGFAHSQYFSMRNHFNF